MADLRKNGATSNLVRFTLKNSSTGVGLTGLTSASAGLIISTIADNEATATAYTVTGATIETIATLGTFAAPTATKCRFKEVDATNHPGLYEFQFADARFAVANAKRLVISVSGAASLLAADYEILLWVIDPFAAAFAANVTQLLGTAWLTPAVAGTPDVNAKQLGGTAQTGRDVGASVLLSSGSGAGQLDFTSGVVKANLAQILGTALTETAGQIAGAFKKFFDKATPTGTINSLPDAVAGAASGVAIVGSNVGAATSVSGAVGSVTGNVGGNVVGSVASVTAAVTVGTNNDKTGYGLSAAAVQAIWDALTTALTTVGSIGKLLVDNINATISSRLASASYTAPPTATENADALLKRDMSAVTGESARSPLNALRFLRNKWSISGTTLTVTKEDDVTSAWTSAVTTNAAAVPVTGNDPT